MGGEFGQFIEWRFAEGLEWKLLEYDSHRGMNKFAKDLNLFYRNNRSMHENDQDWSGFQWIDESDREHSVLSFVRSSRSGRDKTVVVANFAAQTHAKYQVGVPAAGEYEVVLATDDREYGGQTTGYPKMKTKKIKDGRFGYAIEIDLPELSAVYIKKVRKSRISDK